MLPPYMAFRNTHKPAAKTTVNPANKTTSIAIILIDCIFCLLYKLHDSIHDAPHTRELLLQTVVVARRVLGPLSQLVDQDLDRFVFRV
jgi:hypothetical protein